MRESLVGGVVQEYLMKIRRLLKVELDKECLGELKCPRFYHF